MNLDKLALKSVYANASLTTRFAIHSLICVGIMTIALWFIVSNYLINKILDREWRTTAQIVRADVRKFLVEYDFKAQDRKSVGPKFAALLDHMRLAPEIIRFRVYNPKAIVIWSDNKQLVGKYFGDNPQLQKALRGNVIADMGARQQSDNAMDGKATSPVVEVYVPIYGENGKELLGVFETYRRPDAIFRAVHEARLVVLLGAVGGGLLLYVSLFAIMHRAARKIAESSIRAAAQVALLDAEGADGSGQNSKMRENLQSIMQQVDRVQKRMQGLLNFAKPLEPRPSRVEVNSVVREVMETMGARFSDAKVTLDLDLDAASPSVSSDVNQLEQALMVLITNALEATPKGGSVTIRTKSSDHNGAGAVVQLSIEDTGEGIPAENRERVFEPFFTTKPHGTGIGLSLAKKFVERNGGTITIANGVNTGTKVEVTLPRAA